MSWKLQPPATKLKITQIVCFSQNDYDNYTHGTSWLTILLLAGDTPLPAGVIVAVSISAIMFVLLMIIAIIIAIMCITKGGKGVMLVSLHLYVQVQ